MGVHQWQAGSIWNELVAVRDLRVRPCGPKGPQVTLTLFDATGERTAKSWNLSSDHLAILTEAASSDPPLLHISGYIEDNGAYAGQVVIENVSHAQSDEVDPNLFLEPLPLDQEQRVTGLDTLISQVRDPHFADLLARTIGVSGRYREVFVTAVAAQRNHHAYRGGLLRHSLEVAEFALMTLPRFPGMDRDLLLTAALLHDFGKVWEMDHEWRRGEFSSAGSLLGHIHLGAGRIDAICRSLRFPDALREQLVHSILAHHDELPLGSPVRPMTAEAIMIAKCDQISAELTAYFEALRAKLPGQTSVKRGDRWFFFGDREFPGVTSHLSALPGKDPEEQLLQRLASPSPLETSSFGIARLRVLGTVAAGDGIQSAEADGAEERVVLLPEGGADFLLRVTGDSMTGAGIVEGDLLLVRRQETARPGQIVIAHTPGHGPVVKRLTETATGRFLKSENPDYPPIPVTEGVRVQGVVVRLERVF